MTTGAVSSVFVDTNILVYANLTSAPFHMDARRALLTLQATGADLWISRQVLREYLAVVTRQTFSNPLSAMQAATDIRNFEQQFKIADENSSVTSHLLVLAQTIVLSGKQVHDANIIATMLVYGINRLLTHNVADFTRFSHLVDLIPLIPPTPSAST